MTLFEFYRSKEWERFRQIVIAERIGDDGYIRDEVTGEPILNKYDLILHHKIELTEENVNDFCISLNPDNIMIVSHRTHNLIHEKLLNSRREVFLVYGAPLSGKAEWVKDNANEGDLIVDIDSIWQCVSGCERYVKPNRLRSIVFRTRDTLIDAVKYRYGKWRNAYVIGGYPLLSERERLCKELSAREVFIDKTKDECLLRLETLDGIDKKEFRQYIDDWYSKYIPPIE